MSRPSLARATALLLLLASTSACSPAGPRALVLVDGGPDASRADVAARAAAFAKHGRPVHVLHVDAKSAVELAARGEADVALVPDGTPLGDFVTSGRGRALGPIEASGAQLEILEVDGKLHPTVDADGAHALAAHLLSGGRPD